VLQHFLMATGVKMRFPSQLVRKFSQAVVLECAERPRRRTRQFLPGGLLINGTEILPDCRVANPQPLPRRLELRGSRHAL
jgi:hypothetical protein